MAFYLKQNDTSPAILRQFLDAAGNPIDLTGAAVSFSMATTTGTLVCDAKAATVFTGTLPDELGGGTVTAADGWMRYIWTAADTAIAGQHIAEFRVTFPDSSIETVPNSTYETVNIAADISAANYPYTPPVVVPPDNLLGAAAFATRAEFVTWVAAQVGIDAGLTVDAAGFSYRYLGTGTAIADLPGFVPLGDAYPDHWAQNLIPGTTDMAAAIQSALASYTEVRLAKASYAVGTSINILNRNVEGDHLTGGARLIGLAASIPIADPIVKIGGSSVLRGVRIGYDAIAGAETEGQRVGIRTWADGSFGTLQRGSVLDELRIDTVGTAIYDDGVGFFSVTVGTLDIRSHSFRGIDLQATGRTGSVFHNVYINGESQLTWTPDAGVYLYDGNGENFIQLNIEHTAYQTAPIHVDGTQGLLINNLHIEGVDTTASNQGYVLLENANVQITKCRVVNTRMTTGSNLSIFRMGRAGQISTGAPTREFSQLESFLKIGELGMNGLADPDNAKYPSYPTGRNGVHNIPGFSVFARDPAFTDGLWNVEVDSYTGGPYNGESPDDDLLYAFPDKAYSGSLTVTRFKDRGRYVAPAENYLKNGNFDLWYGTTATATGTGNARQLAKHWDISSNTGSITATIDPATDGSPGDGHLKLAVTAGTFQQVGQRIPFHAENANTNMRLAFEMKADVAGQVLHQITANLTNTGGTPSSVFKQVEIGTNVIASTTWQYFEIDYTSIASSAVSAWGPAPFVTLAFQFNEASAVRSPTVYLRNVRLFKPWGSLVRREPLDREELTAWDVAGADNYNSMSWHATVNNTALVTRGLAAPTILGTATAAVNASTNGYTYFPKVEYIGTAGVNAIAGFYSTERVVSIGGTVAGAGGFRFAGRFGIATDATNTTHRAFFGLANAIAAPTDVEPSTLISCLGVAYDAADTNMSFMFNDGTGACTKIDLGSQFPVPTADRTTAIELFMRSPRGTVQRVDWKVVNLNNGEIAAGVVTGNIPAATALLTPRGWMGTGTTNAVPGFALGYVVLSPAS